VSAAWVSAACALLIIIAGFTVFAARWVVRILLRTVQFLHDWEGEQEREGVAARPGVMLRLHSVEDSLATIVTEVSPDGGKSLRDAVNRAAADVATIKDEQARVRAELTRLQNPRP
jgi:hypothetical protein